MKDYQTIVADILAELRAEAHLSKAAMAERMMVDGRTYARYEAGSSAPSLPEFLALLDTLDAPVLPVILRHLYPEAYKDTGTDSAAARRAVLEYVRRDASARTVMQLAYILLGPHGSSQEAQMQLFTAIDHLSMDVRLMVAKLVLNAWEIAEARGGCINMDYIGPDAELLREAIIKATRAVTEGRSSYTAAVK